MTSHCYAPEAGYFGTQCALDNENGCLCDPPIDFFSGYVTHPSKVTRPYASFHQNPRKYGDTFLASEGLSSAECSKEHRDQDSSDDNELDNFPEDYSPLPRVVNSWNGWDPLEEVVVGSFADGRMMAIEETFACFQQYADNIKYYGLPPYPVDGNFGEQFIKKACQAQENLVNLLKNENIVVRRPEKIPLDKIIQTPLWDIDHCNSTACPRDVMITLGNTIVEATMNQKSRYFEHVAYRTLLNEYFHRDPNFHWIAAPKPTHTSVMIRKNFNWNDFPAAEKLMSSGDCLLTEHEPLFDAASILRMGKDLFVIRDVRTNLSGITWLQRLFKNQFRIHPVFIPNDTFPWHIDSELLCLRQPEDGRPGVILTNAGRLLDDCYKKLFEPDWQVIPSPWPNHTRSPEYCGSSTWLNVNSLVIGPTTIVVEKTEKNMINFCESYGIRVLQVDFRDAYLSGGGLHCGTLDIRRRGEQKDYMPTLTKRIAKQQKKQLDKCLGNLASKADAE